MTMNLHIPDVSPTAGQNGVLGAYTVSNLTAAITDILFSSIVGGVRLDHDVATNSYNFTDIPDADANANTNPAGFRPWGAESAFSAQDECWLADTNIAGFMVEIITPAVFNGDGLQVTHSTDGDTMVDVPDLVDPTDGFRAAAGFYEITFGGHASRLDIRPRFGLPKRKYVAIKPRNLTSPTTAPVIRVWPTRTPADIRYVSFLPTMNGALNSFDFTGFPTTSLYRVGAAAYFASASKIFMIEDDMHRRAVPGAREWVYEYLAADDTFRPFELLNDEGDGLENGPAVAATNAGEIQKRRIRLLPPADWVAKSMSFPMTDNTTLTHSGFWFRFRITAASSIGPNPVPLWRRRVVECANVKTPVYHIANKTYSGASYTMDVPPLSDAELAVVFSNGVASRLTFPAGIATSALLSAQHLLFAPQIAVAAGTGPVVMHVSGGALTGIRLNLEE